MRGRPLLSTAIEYSAALPAGALIALVWANAAPSSYVRTTGALAFPVNQIAMAFFFGLAAKEVVEATAPGGALHTWRRAALPAIAACGGMAAPAILYVAIVRWLGAGALARGWAIPCATDVAFSFLIARAIFRRHPAIPFLLLLAVADDALGLVVLVLFYPSHEVKLLVGSLLLASAMIVAFGLRKAGVRSFWPYVLGGGSLSWTALFVGGLHPALALVPIVPFMPRSERDQGFFVEAPASAHDTLSAFEHAWKAPVQVVLFLFGLMNAGVSIRGYGPGTWAVLASVVAGKPLGIVASVAAASAAGFQLPHRFGWRDLVVVGCAAGIGFTVALFFATAAFPPGALQDQAKLGALLSVGAGVVTLFAAAVLRVGRFNQELRN